jgi:hypothetical protein
MLSLIGWYIPACLKYCICMHVYMPIHMYASRYHMTYELWLCFLGHLCVHGFIICTAIRSANWGQFPRACRIHMHACTFTHVTKRKYIDIHNISTYGLHMMLMYIHPSQPKHSTLTSQIMHYHMCTCVYPLSHVYVCTFSMHLSSTTPAQAMHHTMLSSWKCAYACMQGT